MALSIMTHKLMSLSTITLSIASLSIKTLTKITPSIAVKKLALNTNKGYAECFNLPLYWLSLC